MKTVLKVVGISAVIALCSTTILASHTGFFDMYDYVQVNLKGFPAQTTLSFSGFDVSTYTLNSHGRNEVSAKFQVDINGEGSTTLGVNSAKLGIGCLFEVQDTGSGVVYAFQPLCQHVTLSPIMEDAVTGNKEITLTYSANA